MVVENRVPTLMGHPCHKAEWSFQGVPERLSRL